MKGPSLVSGLRVQIQVPPLLGSVTLIKYITPMHFGVLKNKIGIIRGIT